MSPVAHDIVNFGPLDTVPPTFLDRTVDRHTAAAPRSRSTEADAALVRDLRADLRPGEVIQVDSDVNDPVFARARAERLGELHRSPAEGR